MTGHDALVASRRTLAAMSVLLVLLLSLATVGCTLTTGDDAAAPTEPAEVDERVREVDRQRAAADETVDEAHAATLDAQEALERTRRAALVGRAVEEADAVHRELDELDPEGIRTRLRELATTVDEARSEVATARAATGDGEGWERRYLDAQDEMLEEVRRHAASGDALVQLVDRHRPTYVSALEVVDEVAAERAAQDDEAELADDEPGEADDPGTMGERDDADTAQAMQEELAGLLEPLEVAEEELDSFAQRRREAGQRVNEAAADAATVFDQRPDA